MIRAGLLLLGAWTAVVGMVVHRHAWHAGGLTWPWGLVLVVAVTVVVVRVCSGLHRIGAAWFALGWAGVLMLERVVGGPSYLVATDWVGWSFMLASLAIAGWDVFRASRVDA